MSRQFAILGLGYFGVTVAQELIRQNDDVLGIDRNQDRVNALSNLLTHALVADISDEQTLSELSLTDYDAVIIDVDDNLEDSMTCTLLLRELGVREIWVKAHSDTHYRLLRHLGARHVVYPEYDTGVRVAQSLHYHALVDFIDMGDHQFVVELQTTENLCNSCATVAELELDNDKLSLIAIKRGRDVLKAPDPDTPLQEKDSLILMGDLDDLRKLGNKL
ncbi:TrkA family potassium uptake protein [Halomonas sp. PR-M31]|uniref:potassium channel family protein n=1 Tax=Halomonas sp. PR-M31 TaxID=1471202 RepID=UPI0006509EC0|nr:NAD-binding protein [Halomonas sp. PR-M31]